MKLIANPSMPKSSTILSFSGSGCLAHQNPFAKISTFTLNHNEFKLKPTASSTKTYAAASSTALPKPPAASPIHGRRTQNPNSRPQSLYSRPSLLQMKNTSVANRVQVYEFLRGLGIVPDELDGLELPVTVDVMRERIDCLHSLGLTIDDINNYPLVLGCSVKKNMIPVLDYLGNLGVRRSGVTDFLRRYPQVLHSSVVVDLKPVVNYLQGLDIKPRDIPRVLERYPELLGFKLEGTMSTSVAYLVGIGVARREVGRVLTRYPEILGMRVAKVIKPFVEYLETLGLPRLAVARLIEKSPHILGFQLDDRVKPNVEALVEFGVRRESLASVIAQYTDIMGIELRTKLAAQLSLFESNMLAGRDELGKMIERMPQTVSLGRATVLKHVEFLKRCGFSLKQVSNMVVACPQILALNIDIMSMSFEYFKTEMDRDLEDLAEFPAYFTYSLESTIKFRHQMIAEKGLKCSLGWLLNCSDEKFAERMSYDSIGIEEMEAEPTFDMKTLIEARTEDETDDDNDSSEYDEDSEYEDM